MSMITNWMRPIGLYNWNNFPSTPSQITQIDTSHDPIAEFLSLNKQDCWDLWCDH